MDCLFPDMNKGTACVQCGWIIPFAGAEDIRRNCLPCIHLGKVTKSYVQVTCTCLKGSETKRLYQIYPCTIYGECVPEFRCTQTNKEAVKETWTRSDGIESVDKLAVCRGCISYSPLTDNSI